MRVTKAKDCLSLVHCSTKLCASSTYFIQYKLQMMQLSFTCKIKTTVLGFKIGLKVVQKSDETVYSNGPHRKVSL